jgi:hypothetical protein
MMSMPLTVMVPPLRILLLLLKLVVVVVIVVTVVSVTQRIGNVVVYHVTALSVPTSKSVDVSTILSITQRQALMDRSQQINPPFTTTSISSSSISSSSPPLPPYTQAGWSNRAATVLTPIQIGPDFSVYTADRPFFWNNIDVGCRATIIEIPKESSSSSLGGNDSDDTDENRKPDLWVHSPVHLDGPMLQCLQSIGRVRYICSTNYEHLKFAALWYQTFHNSGADMWGCPNLAVRMPEIPWKGEIPYGYRPVGWMGGVGASTSTNTSNTNTHQPDPDGIWDTTVIQPLHINIEQNPFTRQPFFNEVIFYHAPSKTLLCTDLFWNYPAATGIANSQYGRNDTWELAPSVDRIPIGSRLWKWGMDQVYYPFFHNYMVTNTSEYQAIAHHIVHVWDVETVIPAHGDILRGKEFIRSVLTKYFQLEGVSEVSEVRNDDEKVEVKVAHTHTKSNVVAVWGE